MRFKDGNNIKCYQDHFTTWYPQIPPGIDWEVEPHADYALLRAPGYGDLKRGYGNGALTAMATPAHLFAAEERGE